MTTPGCDEVVEWFVLDNPVLTISDEQVLSFQSIEDSHGYPMLTNARPIQDINFRKVRRSFAPFMKPLPKNKNLLSAIGHTETQTNCASQNCDTEKNNWNPYYIIGTIVIFGLIISTTYLLIQKMCK